MKIIDDFLNKTTMYRLVLYCLLFLFVIALFFSFIGKLPFTPISLILSTIFLVAVGWITNTIFAKVYNATTNLESVYITTLILSLILTPFQNHSFQALPLLFWAAVLAVSSKYILAINKKHIFNPVAISVVITDLALGSSASWWVGTAIMAPFVLLSGLLIVRKTKRTDLVFSFILIALIVTFGQGMLKGSNAITLAKQVIFDSPILFFAFVMLTEPLTTPPTKTLQSLYGGIVGFLFSPYIHFGTFFTTPEIALVAGNIFSYLVSPKEKLTLKLKEKIKAAPDIFDFVFVPTENLAFAPGQYMEWTLAQTKPDSRGSRRYFTLASSPTEQEIRIGVKFYDQPSSFKKELFALSGNKEITAAQVAGDFVLPADQKKKLIFVAGGIGITPYRSMVKYLIDNHEKRDIVLFYSNKLASEIVYKNIFDQAERDLGIRTVYILTDEKQLPQNWSGKTGYINEAMVKAEVPDFNERIFYLSGPHTMVDAYKKTLLKMGIRSSQIKTDFFPGFA